jgi:L-asparaginase
MSAAGARRRVVMVFTGGTIAMRIDSNLGGAVPTLDAQGILERTRGLDEIADVDVIDWGRVPATHITFAQIIELAAILDRSLRRSDIDGAILVQGTDNIEETSYALDLLLESTKPVVVVGAMRNADEDGYEGPVNIRDAVRCAVSPHLAGQGVLVVMSGEVHAADDVTKVSPSAYAAFESPNFGPLGLVDDGRLTVLRQRSSARRIMTAHAVEPIPLIRTHLGIDGALVRLAQASGARGFVIEGAGTGNTPPDLLAACVDAMAAGLPVVMTSRCLTGRARPAYAFPGGSVTWRNAGAIFAEYLSGLKARIALSLALGAGMNRRALEEFFSR